MEKSTRKSFLSSHKFDSKLEAAALQSSSLDDSGSQLIQDKTAASKNTFAVTSLDFLRCINITGR